VILQQIWPEGLPSTLLPVLYSHSYKYSTQQSQVTNSFVTIRIQTQTLLNICSW
jgi:hypothetical protein